MSDLIIRTSETSWLSRLATAYKNKTPLTLVDDAGVGIDPQTQTILDMGKAIGLSPAAWVAILVALGMSVFGAWMIVAAIADPEPTSKLSLLVGGGTICVLGGGFTAVRILTKYRPPNVKVTKNGFEINWD